MSSRVFDVWSEPCSSFVGAVGHHAHFTQCARARERIAHFCETIRHVGTAAFIEREYPRPGEMPADRADAKAIIVNVVNATPCLVDGNAHLVSLVMCDPGLTLSGLVHQAGRCDFVRIWHEGWEPGSRQDGPYVTYIPPDTDVRRIPWAQDGVNGFVQPPARVKVIPSGIAFDSTLFSVADRGRPLGETARSLLLMEGDHDHA